MRFLRVLNCGFRIEIQYHCVSIISGCGKRVKRYCGFACVRREIACIWCGDCLCSAGGGAVMQNVVSKLKDYFA